MTKTADLKVIEQIVRKKPRKYNKNKKKAWRKKIDISDVEEALNDQRREERYGGALGERQSDDLFQLDFRDQKQELEEEKLKKKKSLKKGRNRVKRLKCHQFLDGLPGVRPITKIRPTYPQYPSKMMRTAINRSGDSLKDGVKRLIAQDQRKTAKIKDKRSLRPLSQNNVTTDIWTDGPPGMKKKYTFGNMNQADLTFLKKGLNHYKTETKQKFKKAPKIRTKKPNRIPAIILPDSGASYNPSLRDHQMLMSKVIRQEENRLLVEKKKKEIRDRIFASHRTTATQESYLKEMSEGLKKDEEDSGRGSSEEILPEEEGERNGDLPENENASSSVSAPRITEKKSKQQKLKAKRVKIAEYQRQAAKLRRIQQSNVYRVKSYLKEIKQMENLKKKRSLIRKQKEEKMKYTTRQLSRHKFLEADESVALGDQLPDSMRMITPMGSIMVDQFKSLQRRNIIEPKGKGRHPKRKEKKFTKRSKRKNQE